MKWVCRWTLPNVVCKYSPSSLPPSLGSVLDLKKQAPLVYSNPLLHQTPSFLLPLIRKCFRLCPLPSRKEAARDTRREGGGGGRRLNRLLHNSMCVWLFLFDLELLNNIKVVWGYSDILFLAKVSVAVTASDSPFLSVGTWKVLFGAKITHFHWLTQSSLIGHPV